MSIRAIGTGKKKRDGCRKPLVARRSYRTAIIMLRSPVERYHYILLGFLIRWLKTITLIALAQNVMIKKPQAMEQWLDG